MEIINVDRKFSDSLTFNSSPELQGHYIAYDALKEAIYRLEKQTYTSASSTARDLESAHLLADHPDETPTAKIFIALLEKELSTIVAFYKDEEKKVLDRVTEINMEIETIESADWSEEFERELQDNDDDDADSIDSQEGNNKKANKMVKSMLSQSTRRLSRSKGVSGKHGRKESGAQDALTGPEDRAEPDGMPARKSVSRRRPSLSTQGDGTIWSATSDWATDTRITFKLRLQNLYRELTQLKQYCSLNYTGFRKIIKKFDKTTDNNIQKPFMAKTVDQSYPFLQSTKEQLDAAIESVIQQYTRIIARGDREWAIKQLRTQLREFVVFERNTVWRDMVGMHSRHLSGAGGGVSSKPILTDVSELKGDPHAQSPASWSDWLRTALKTKEMIGGVIGVTLFLVLLFVPIMKRPEEQNCLALLALATVFWAVEVIPLFVTSLGVPLLVVVLRVVRSQDGQDRRLTAPETTKYIFAQMFSPTIMLLIGGFTLAAALSKHNIDKMLATRVLSLAGTSPRVVLLAYMGVACFASMWISNVAAPVLCFSLIQPVLRSLPPKTPYARALILGIALAANIGGQSSPISSPQNLIALEYMDPQLSWLQWFAISLPVSATSVILIGLLLMWSYSWDANLTIAPVRQSRDTFSAMQYFVSIVAVVTIVLWCFSHSIDNLFGDMGIIAILPLLAFYGSGALRKSDFEGYPWAIVFLAMGGISLGKAVLASGLLDDIDAVIQTAVKGLDIWPILALSSIVCIVIATFVSHTVASVLLVPVAAQIGQAMEDPHPRLLIMSTALICSAGMGLPISGFPNMTASSVENDVGQTYLAVTDFLRNGIPASIIATAVVITLLVSSFLPVVATKVNRGYLLMRLLGL